MGWNIFWQLSAIVIAGTIPCVHTLFAASEADVTGGSQMLPSAQAYVFTSIDELQQSNLNESLQGIHGLEVFTPEFDQRESVQKYISYFSEKQGREWLIDGMRRAEPVRDFILAYLSANQMPRELFFLVMIESSFSVNAISRSGAAGLWQFMLNSSGHWMRNTEWLDERFDFWASTHGALAKLKENYAQFDDWLLALAAYNAGAGRIKRLLKKTHAKTFWELQKSPLLPVETRDYVPKILAASYIGSHPGRYGLPLFWNRIVQWDKVAVPGGIQVSQLERDAGIPKGVLALGNAELRFDLTPPGKKSHYLKVPRQYTQSILETLKGGPPQMAYAVHAVVHGDTLYAICRQYRTKVSLIYEFNPGIKPSVLRIGQKLIIPLLPASVSSDIRIEEKAS